MKTGMVVIGANYGDEGKGLITDYLASQDPTHNSVVVRFNGGAQAGHTVVLPDGRRHVFSHFGAGTLAGAPTYLSQFFIVNPILLIRELAQLQPLHVHRPILAISNAAMVTTPFDMFINQTIERKRGITRHGSCGLGINETVTRSLLSNNHKIKATELRNGKTLLEKLMFLGQTWFISRLREHHIDETADEVSAFIAHMPQILNQYINDVEIMVALSNITEAFPQGERLIFEGAQGLMLDEDRIDQWPHVTRSKTGLDNVVFLAKKFGLDSLEVTYVSRTYLTRHGAGSLVGECNWKLPDRTNIANQFQGHLRFAPLDCNQLQNSIRLDLARAKRSFPDISAKLAMTWADQISLPDRDALPLPVAYVSYGPTRDDIMAVGDMRDQKKTMLNTALLTAR
ncbi:MAG TPA: adenylosuccinate synthetase [Trichormus sp.]|jgi:adenylosuccinate synthase